VNKRKGFTLVELLVVIAIIALLMGILLPALARVRRSAKGSACMVQVKQWATVYSMYTGDWEGYFHADYEENETDRVLWYEALEPYYKDRKLLLCPSATKVRFVDGTTILQGDEGGKNPEASFITAYDSSGKYDGRDPADPTKINPYYKMSFAINSWLCDKVIPPGVLLDPEAPGPYDRPYVNRWITVNRFTQPNLIPLFGDGAGYSRLFPQAYTKPPLTADTLAGETGAGDANGGTKDRMMSFCLRRHGPLTNPNIDIAFGDFSVRPVGLKALWSLTWHKRWIAARKGEVTGGNAINRDMSDDTYPWPEWMKGYSSDGVINY